MHDNLHHQLYSYAVREEIERDGEIATTLRDIYMRRLAPIAPVTAPGMSELLQRYGTDDAIEITERFAKRTRDAIRESGGASGSEKRGKAGGDA